MSLVRLCNKFSHVFQVPKHIFCSFCRSSDGNCFVSLFGKFLHEIHRTIRFEQFPSKHFHWFRFVDDIQSVWEREQHSIKYLLVHLNLFESNLQFTIELEDSGKLPFLDGLILKNTSNLNFSIYRTPTHNDFYLHFSSNQPPIKGGIPISLVETV